MGPEIINKLKDSEIDGDFVGHDNIHVNIILFQDSERKFVVTHNADIKPVSYFTGRETELQELRQRIEEGRKSVLVSGMGGIGKTQICRQLFEEYSKNENGSFSHIGYIEYDGDMNSSLQRCLKFKEQERQEDNLKAAWKELEFLAADGKLLLFVDNVSVPIGQDAGLRQLKQIPGAVVLTSRRTSFSKEFEPFKVGFLSTEQCKAVYEKILYEDINNNKKVPDAEVPDLIYIIEKLTANHTITIKFLAHLARTKNWTAITLRKELETRGFCLKYKDKYNDDRFINIQEEYEKLYDLSELTDAEQNILEAFSVFPYIPLEAEICNQWLLEDAGAGEEDVLVGLYRKGWLQFDTEQESYSIHPVFAQFIYAKCKPKAERHYGLMEGCQKCLKIPDSGSAMECQKFIPFAENIVKKVNMKASVDQIKFVSVFAYLLQCIAQYKKAEKLYFMILEECKEKLNEYTCDYISICNNLAYIFEKQGEYGKAEVWAKKAIWICNTILREGHSDAAKSYNILGIVYQGQGNYKKAEELYRKSLQIRKKEFGEGHLDTSISYHNLAGVYAIQGEQEKAIILYKKCLQIQKNVLGENHPSIARIYNNLATVYQSRGDYRVAEGLYVKSLHIRKNKFGEEHPSIARIYNNLAAVYQSQEKINEAEKLYKKSLVIRRKVLGENHPDTARSYFNLASNYVSQWKYGDALTFFFKSYNIFLSSFGVDHTDTKIVYDNMKLAYSKLNPEGDFEQWLKEQMKESD